MGLYSRYVLPKLVHLTCSTKPNMRQREKVVPMAEGTVLEIGIGSGLKHAVSVSSLAVLTNRIMKPPDCHHFPTGRGLLGGGCQDYAKIMVKR